MKKYFNLFILTTLVTSSLVYGEKRDPEHTHSIDDTPQKQIAPATQGAIPKQIWDPEKIKLNMIKRMNESNIKMINKVWAEFETAKAEINNKYSALNNEWNKAIEDKVNDILSERVLTSITEELEDYLEFLLRERENASNP